MTRDEAKVKLVRVAALMQQRGLVFGAEGNASVRLDSDTIAVTPSNVPKEDLTPYMLGGVDIASGEQIDGTLPPSTELDLHLTAYRERPDANAVLHAHPTYAVAVTLALGEFPNDYLSESLIGLGLVATAPYATPGSSALSDAVRPLLAAHDCVVMLRHGALVLGSSPDDAFRKLEMLEHTASICYHALVLDALKGGSGSERLPTDEVHRLLERHRAGREAARRKDGNG